MLHCNDPTQKGYDILLEKGFPNHLGPTAGPSFRLGDLPRCHMCPAQNEVREMELRIGVLQHATLQHKVRQANMAKKQAAAGPKKPDEGEDAPAHPGPAA